MLIFDGLSGLLLGGASALGTGVRDSFKNQYSKDVASARGEETYIDADGKERFVKNNHRVGKLMDHYTHDLLLCDADRNYKVIKDLTLEHIEEEKEKQKQKAIEKGEKYYYLYSNSALLHEAYKNVKGDKYYSVDDDEMYVHRVVGTHTYFMNVKSRIIGERCPDPVPAPDWYVEPPTDEREIEWIKKWNYAVSKLGYYQDDYLNNIKTSVYDDYVYVFLVDIKED